MKVTIIDKFNFLTSKKIVLVLIIFLAAILRLYKLDNIPSALNWDEVAGAYNAYSIANWGKDEWGQILPLVFTSFRDDKHPVHIYIVALIVKIFGLSDFTARFPSVLIGILNVLVIFYLAQILFKSYLVAIFSSLSLAISPYHMHFSRGLWEANFAPFFFMLGLLLFYLAIQKKGWLINLSFLSFGVSILTYHSSKIVIPPIILLLIILYFKDLKKLSGNFYTGMLILSLFVILLFVDQRLLGLARAKQTQFGKDEIEKTQVFSKTKSSTLGLGEIILKQYTSHFTPKYLFIAGDQSPRNSVKTFGEFYPIDAVFIIVGLFFLIKLRSRISLIIFTWFIISPVPSSLVGGAPNAARAIFMIGVVCLLIGLGISNVLGWLKGSSKSAGVLIILVLITFQAIFFLNYYFNVYPKKDAHEWQYGMKQIVEFVKSHSEYNQVFVTDIRSQPYIFFLFYLNEPLPQYLDSVVYNRLDESKRYNLVSSFDGFYVAKNGQPKLINLFFGGWDTIESVPDKGILYVLSPSQYDGLKHRSSFKVKKIIYYPDGGTVFYLVSG